MKHRLLFSALALFATTLTSCEITETVPDSNLEVTVTNSAGTLQSGASVKVMKTGSTTADESSSTNSFGKATFTLDGDQRYTVEASKGSLGGTTSVTNMLVAGNSYTVTVVIR
ncbi:hypothetical protein LJY25_07930 [Hymenobacter sp. BT175]|uniref:hypothetical protein n=1 Tax=Hymenobacter translucens TaxID=2886507 RepID=UPI001D0E56AA|nr:hypothetical protein [Hymenobacter translucens]MCC2546370.1 hypothetical protein [Hymenobacter translucens]